MTGRTGRYLALAAGTAAALFFAAAPALHATQASQLSSDASVSVSMVSNVYAPTTITVSAGTTVTWSNDEDPNCTDVTHDVIADDYSSWSSDYLDPGGTYSRTFDTPGSYHYLCDLHPGMEGTVIVQ